MSDAHKNIVPRIYFNHDPDLIFETWSDLVSYMADNEDVFANLYQEIVDPDTAPISFVEMLLASLGNPFKDIYLTDLQKRKLARLLLPMYRQKDTGRGIINAVRFFLGIEVEIIDPHAGQTWQIGYSEVGLESYVGGDRFYKNMLDYTEDFDNAAWTKTSASIVANSVTGPPPWGRTADTLTMTSAGATISQAATPMDIAGETFTGSIWLKSASNASLTAIIRAQNNPSIDFTSTTLNVTTEWQRFEFSHECLGGATGDIEFVLTSSAGFAPLLYGFGAQLVRDDVIQPYLKRTNDGTDEYGLGRWGYHFFIQSPVELDDDQRNAIEIIADFMKANHKHYTIIDPSDVGFIDHWEIGLSYIGVNTYVHS